MKKLWRSLILLGAILTSVYLALFAVVTTQPAVFPELLTQGVLEMAEIGTPTTEEISRMSASELDANFKAFFKEAAEKGAEVPDNPLGESGKIGFMLTDENGVNTYNITLVIEAGNIVEVYPESIESDVNPLAVGELPEIMFRTLAGGKVP